MRRFERAAEADGARVSFDAPLLDALPLDVEAALTGCAGPDDLRRIAGLRERLPELPVVAVLAGPQAGRVSLGVAAREAGAEQLLDPARTRGAGFSALWRHLQARVAANRRLAIERAATDRFVEAFRQSVAHDLRGPLHVIRGFSEALIAGEVGEIDATARDYLRRMVAKADRMDGLVAALLALAGVARGALDPLCFDLSSAVRDAIARVGQAGALELDAGAGCEVRADRRRMTIALAACLDEWLAGSPDPILPLRFEARRTRDRVDCMLDLPPAAGARGPGLMALECIVERHGGLLRRAPLAGGRAAIRFSLPAPD